jgi:NAD(P)-dependent dehydrogenase (short-subunit alcohol dehydrogenase family)
MNEIIERDCRDILSQVSLKNLKGKKVLITGANGFIGQYIAAAISTANRKLGVKCRVHTTGLHGPRAILDSILRADKKFSYFRLDLTKPFKLGGYDYIFHAAGYAQPTKFVGNPASTVAINIDAPRRLITASPGATFVFSVLRMSMAIFQRSSFQCARNTMEIARCIGRARSTRSQSDSAKRCAQITSALASFVSNWSVYPWFTGRVWTRPTRGP